VEKKWGKTARQQIAYPWKRRKVAAEWGSSPGQNLGSSVTKSDFYFKQKRKLFKFAHAIQCENNNLMLMDSLKLLYL